MHILKSFNYAPEKNIYCFTSTFIATLQLMRQLGFSPLSNVKVFEFLYILSNAFPFDFFISTILKTPISY